ncbi:hypothetical protein M1397_02055 [Candidatus Marsarchaeota archaeon]|jgi:DNA repair exonuclease SbcCD ATPase subunit|nr:hypothetical protein [Candidatus Marsarchaeota archaeon]
MAERPTAETRTAIDSLIGLLRQRGKMDLNSIANALNTDIDVVERWAKVLEKDEMVKITYEVGKMFIAPATLTKEQEKTLTHDIQMKASALSETATSQIMSLQSIENSLKAMKGTVAEASKVEAQELPELKKAIGELNAIFNSVDQNKRAIDLIYKNTNAMYDSISKKADSLVAKINQVQQTALPNAPSSDELRLKISEIEKGVAAIKGQISAMRRSTNESIEEIRKGVGDQFKVIDGQLEKGKKDLLSRMKTYQDGAIEAERQLAERLKLITTISDEIKAFTAERDHQINQIRSSKVEFENSYTRAMAKMKKQSEEVEAMSNAMAAKINAIKSKFGSAPGYENSISELDKHLSEMENRVSGAKREAEEIQNQLAGVLSLADLSVTKKEEAIDTLGKKANQNSEKLNGIRSDMDNVTNRIKKLGPSEEKKDDENGGK